MQASAPRLDGSRLVRLTRWSNVPSTSECPNVLSGKGSEIGAKSLWLDSRRCGLLCWFGGDGTLPDHRTL